MEVLSCLNLVKDFNGKRAVDDVSLQLKAGEILGLLGPNGAGKTTTIRMILNIIIPDSGSISLLGRPFSEELKNQIGFLPEERGLYRKMKVSETLTFFGELKGMKKADIKAKGAKLLEQFNLEAYANKKVEELSKGMAQKLQFITAILHSPRILILDEPFSGLDPLNIELVKDVIMEMKRQEISIVFSTHLMDYAEKIVDSVVMINQGKKVMDGRLSEIKSQSGKTYFHIDFEGNSQFVAELDYVKEVRYFGHQMEIELTDLKDRNRLLQDLMNRLTLKGFKQSEPSLNQIFIRQVNDGFKSSATLEG